MTNKYLVSLWLGLLFSGQLLAAAPFATPFVPSNVEIPFEPDAELLTRLQQTNCWSEFRLYDVAHKKLGPVVALEWYDKLDLSIARLYLRQDTQQKAYRRLSIKYQEPGSAALLDASSDRGPETVNTRWTATFAVQGQIHGTAVMKVVEGSAEAEEHISLGILSLPGVFPKAVSVAHSAGCKNDD